MTITGAHTASAADSIGGLIELFFHPQRRVYGIWAVWVVSCIFMGVPYGGIPLFHMLNRIFLVVAVLASSIGALQEWKNRGIVFMIVGPVMVFAGSFAGQFYYDVVRATSNQIIHTLIISPIITAGYLMSIFGVLCVGYHVHENRTSRLNSKSLALILMVAASVLILVPLFLMNLGDLFRTIGLFETDVWYSPGAFPYSLLYSLNALYLVALLMVVLFSASILYGVVGRKVGALMFLIGVILFNFPMYIIFSGFSLLTSFNFGLSLMAIGGVWTGAPLATLKRKEKLQSVIDASKAYATKDF